MSSPQILLWNCYITDWISTTRKQLPEETSSEVKGAVPAAKGKIWPCHVLKSAYTYLSLDNKIVQLGRKHAWNFRWFYHKCSSWLNTDGGVGGCISEPHGRFSEECSKCWLTCLVGWSSGYLSHSQAVMKKAELSDTMTKRLSSIVFHFRTRILYNLIKKWHLSLSIKFMYFWRWAIRCFHKTYFPLRCIKKKKKNFRQKHWVTHLTENYLRKQYKCQKNKTRYWRLFSSI